MLPESGAPPLILVVVQIAPGSNPDAALTTLAATRRVLVRRPALAALPIPPGVELMIDPTYERASIAARVRRDAADLVVVLEDDERISPELAANLMDQQKSPPGGSGHPDHSGTAAIGSHCYAAGRRVDFLGAAMDAGIVTFAWQGSGPYLHPPRRLVGPIVTTPASVTTSIDRLEARAACSHGNERVGPSHFTSRPVAAVLRRIWRRRRHGIPGLVLSIIETYGEVLIAAQTWERLGITARRAERQSGVPPGFHIWRTPQGSLTLRDGTPPVLREALLDATPAVVAGMPIAGGRGTVWAVDLGNATRGVLRWYRRGGAIRHLVHDRYFGWTPRPIRELALTEEAIRRGLPAPPVLAARVDRLPWGWYRGAIVTREVAGALTFADELRHHPDGAERARILTTVGRAIRHLHDRGLHHRDLNATNILVSRAGALQVHFIDFDRAIVRDAVGPRVRERELRRLERSLVKLARGGMPLQADDATRLREAYRGASSSVDEIDRQPSPTSLPDLP